MFKKRCIVTEAGPGNGSPFGFSQRLAVRTYHELEEKYTAHCYVSRLLCCNWFDRDNSGVGDYRRLQVFSQHVQIEVNPEIRWRKRMFCSFWWALFNPLREAGPSTSSSTWLLKTYQPTKIQLHYPHFWTRQVNRFRNLIQCTSWTIILRINHISWSGEHRRMSKESAITQSLGLDHISISWIIFGNNIIIAPPISKRIRSSLLYNCKLRF